MLLFEDLFNVQIQQHDESTLPNNWTFIRRSWNSSSLFACHRDLRASLSFSCTITWWNIFSMPTITLYISCLKRSNVPTRLFNKSDPLYSFSFKDVFSYLAPATKTTRIFAGLLMLVKAWCGMYLMIAFYSSFLALYVNLLACPFSMYSVIVSTYMDFRGGCFSNFRSSDDILEMTMFLL